MMASAQMSPDAAIDLMKDSYKQKVVSELIHAETLHRLRLGTMDDRSFQAHLNLCSAHGAGAWIIAFPADEERRASGSLFRVMLRRRLRVVLFANGFQCPACSELMDVYGDHALACQGWGHRTRRHITLSGKFSSRI